MRRGERKTKREKVGRGEGGKRERREREGKGGQQDKSVKKGLNNAEANLTPSWFLIA